MQFRLNLSGKSDIFPQEAAITNLWGENESFENQDYQNEEETHSDFQETETFSSEINPQKTIIQQSLYI